jgi:hypothetical protein
LFPAECDDETGAECCSAGDPKNERVGEGIAQNRLERNTGARQRGSDQSRKKKSRQPHIEENRRAPRIATSRENSQHVRQPHTAWPEPERDDGAGYGGKPTSAVAPPLA